MRWTATASRGSGKSRGQDPDSFMASDGILGILWRALKMFRHLEALEMIIVWADGFVVSLTLYDQWETTVQLLHFKSWEIQLLIAGRNILYRRAHLLIGTEHTIAACGKPCLPLGARMRISYHFALGFFQKVHKLNDCNDNLHCNYTVKYAEVHSVQSDFYRITGRY